MNLLFSSSLIFLVAINAFADTNQQRIDFNSYVRENFDILSQVKKPQKVRLAFQPEKDRDPAASSAQKIDYDVDKTGHVAASSGSVWGSMGGQNSTGQQQQQPTQYQAPQQADPAATSGAASSSSSSGSSPAAGGASGGENLPQ